MNLFRTDRQNRQGGGTAIYVKNNLRCSPMHDTTLTSYPESTWVKVKGPKRDLLIGVIYRPPNTPVTTDSIMVEVIEQLDRYQHMQILIMGDFNLPKNQEEHLAPHRIHSAFRSAGLEQMIQGPTRWANSTTFSALDYVLVNEDGLINNIRINSPLGSSDHCCISFTIKTAITEFHRTTRTIRDFTKVDVQLLQTTLIDSNLQTLEGLADINQRWISIKKATLKAIELSTPIIYPKYRVNYDWLKSSTRKLIRLKRSQWNRFCLTGTEIDWEAYAQTRNLTTTKIKQNRSAYQARLVESFTHNPKSVFRHIARYSTNGAGIPELLTDQGLTSTNLEAARALAYQFIEQSSSSGNVSPPQQPYQIEDNLEHVHITADTVNAKLRKLKIHTSPGPDGIPTSILKHCADILAEPLADLFNHSLASGTVPTEWKTAHITPKFKKGDRQLPQNYRPIALLSAISKVMESILDDRIRKHIHSLNLISPYQHGFMRGRSTTTNLLYSLEDWGKLDDEHRGIDVILLDLSKAFDTVPHNLLKAKLNSLGIGGPLLRWISDYLNNRLIRVKVNGELSDPSPVRAGVPQGSILGPLLFILYINDLPAQIDTKVALFADDLKIWGPSDDSDSLQRNLNAISNWVANNGMTLNPDKCRVIPIKTKIANNYLLNKISIPTSYEERDLGSVINSNLSSSANCEQMALKANRALNLLLRSLGRFQKGSFNKLYTSYVRAHLELNIQALPPNLLKDSRTLERVQRRATKRVKGLTTKSYSDRLKELNLFSLAFRRIRGDMILTHRILNDPSHPNRGLLKLQQPLVKTKQRSAAFSVRVPFIWNRLPKAVVEAPSTETFKKRFDAHTKATGRVFTASSFYDGKDQNGDPWSPP